MQEKIFYEIDFTTSGILGEKGVELARTMPKCDGIVLYAWCAPETVKELENTFKVPILNFNSTQLYVDSTKRAYELASKWAEEGPLGPSGYPILRAIETSVADELSYIYFKEAIREKVKKHFNQSPVVFKIFPENVNTYTSTPRSFFRAVKSLRDQMQGADRFWQDLVSSVDKDFKFRAVANKFLSGPELSENDVWLFSSYENFSKALSEYGPKDARFLLSRMKNPSYIERSRRQSPLFLWRFSRENNANESRKVAKAASSSFDSIKDSLQMNDYNEILNNLKLTIYESVLSYYVEESLLNNFVEAVKPKELWVADQWGSERLLINVAKSFSIPVVQVQHGFPSIYYGYSPLVADKTIVSSSRWKRYFNGEVEVLASAENARSSTKDKDDGRNAIVFTTPFQLVKFFNDEISTHEMMYLIAMFANKNFNVVLRIHPSDSKSKWRNSIKSHRLERLISIDKNAKIGETLFRSNVGIAYFSTALEDCETNQVQSLGLSWQLHPGWSALSDSDWIFEMDSIEKISEWLFSKGFKVE